MTKAEMNAWKIWTGRLLVVSGGFLLLAWVPIFFPVELMQRCHEMLGLGAFPVQPITIYLARSTSLLYFVHGVVTVYVGWHVDRLWPMVRVLGILHLIIGLLMVYVDLSAGMPMFWTLGEGLPITGLGALIVFLSVRGSVE